MLLFFPPLGLQLFGNNIWTLYWTLSGLLLYIFFLYCLIYGGGFLAIFWLFNGWAQCVLYHLTKGPRPRNVVTQ
ncbi:hypothetical protein XELAEV_18026983mg [Xenopus laevis]|uniref:Uncharacterized protein n=1 Tax=Xenopus laevis TaxID=8355 RepID=A0A974CUQ5_XENLA|nr:hypothetical protein XELAEV_18026983mg [Xenopus laevis]